MKTMIKFKANRFEFNDKKFEGLCCGCYTEKIDLFFRNVNNNHLLCKSCFDLVLDNESFPKTTRKGEEIEVEEIIV